MEKQKRLHQRRPISRTTTTSTSKTATSKDHDDDDDEEIVPFIISNLLPPPDPPGQLLHCHGGVIDKSSTTNHQQTVLSRSSGSTSGTKKASTSNLTTSLIKSIVGAGVLALPASIASLGDTSGPLEDHNNNDDNDNTVVLLIVSTAIMIAIGCINAYFFSLIGRVCAMTGAKTYQDAWDKTVGARATARSTSTNQQRLEDYDLQGKDEEDDEKGNSLNSVIPPSSSFVAMIVTFKTVLSCLAFSIILADSFQSIAIGALGFVNVTREQTLLGVSVFILLPLCTFIQDLKTLAPFSFLGLIGMIITIVSMILRCVDGTYATTTMSNNNHNHHYDINMCGGMILACTLATAFVAHYNAPRFFVELDNACAKRFNQVVIWSYGVSLVTFLIVAYTGFLTFGVSSKGFILNNYSSNDPYITTSRIAVAASIALTYPLPFFGLRDGVLDIMRLDLFQEYNDITIKLISVGLLTAITIIAYFVNDVAIVLSVGGGTFSTIISSVIPTLMFRSAVLIKTDLKKNKELKKDCGGVVDDDNDTKVLQDGVGEVKLAMLLMWICIGVGVSGVYVAVYREIHK